VRIRNLRTGVQARVGLVSRQQLIRAIWLGVLIGTVAGVGAIVFFESIDLASEHLLGTLTGYHPPEPLGEGGKLAADGLLESEGPTRLWALPLVLGAGGLVAGLIVFTFAPEAEGHGTDAAIESFHQKGGRTRVRVIPIKLIASAITIGSGGSAGREGPTAQIGGGFGSFVADAFRLGTVERRRALAAGMGAGIGAIFRAPLGGAMMGAEILYKHDLEADVILLSLIASIVAFAIFGAWTDYEPLFGGGAGFSFDKPEELVYYALLGVACGGMGLLYAKGFYGVTGIFKGLKVPRIFKPAIGGVIAGCIGIAMPESIHVGYGYVQQAMSREGIESFSLWLIVLLPFTRVLTTSLSVGSGGSGGIFGPGMVIGAMTGAAAWRLFHGLPGFPHEPGPVVIIGMIAMFGAIAHAPLAVLLMVGEMTGNLSLLAPAMVAVAIATLLVGDTTIYKSQVPSRADSPAHRDRFAFPLLTALPSHRAVVPVPTLHAEDSPAAALAKLQQARVSYGVVVDDHGHLLGDISADALRGAGTREAPDSIAGLTAPVPAVVLSDMPLDQALDLLTDHERRWLPVLDGEGGPVLGAIDTRALMRSYRRAVQSQVRPLTPVTEQVNSMEIRIPEDSPLAGVSLTDAPLPGDVRILTIAREGTVLIPLGSTVLQPGDTLTVTFPAARRREVFALILGQ
jgi:CIC family chloride channel protein